MCAWLDLAQALPSATRPGGDVAGGDVAPCRAALAAFSSSSLSCLERDHGGVVELLELPRARPRSDHHSLSLVVASGLVVASHHFLRERHNEVDAD